jgi:hypothetical protein
LALGVVSALGLTACSSSGGVPLDGFSLDALLAHDVVTTTDVVTTPDVAGDTAPVADATPGDAIGPGPDGPPTDTVLGPDGSMETVLVTGMYTVPAGTVVQEVTFKATGIGAFDLTGGRLTVAVTDLSHPNRDQNVVCGPNTDYPDHPLDGCATVDYGAFGPHYDNRITVDGASGPLSFHMYTDRSLKLDPEPLMQDE